MTTTPEPAPIDIPGGRGTRPSETTQGVAGPVDAAPQASGRAHTRGRRAVIEPPDFVPLNPEQRSAAVAALARLLAELLADKHVLNQHRPPTRANRPATHRGIREERDFHHTTDDAQVPTFNDGMAPVRQRWGAATPHLVACRTDGRGRLADRSPPRMLQWKPGLTIASLAVPGAVVVAAQPDGNVSVTGQGHLRMPATVRHALRLRPGDRLLVAAHPDRGLLVAYPMSTLDTTVSVYRTSLAEAPV